MEVGFRLLDADRGRHRVNAVRPRSGDLDHGQHPHELDEAAAHAGDVQAPLGGGGDQAHLLSRDQGDLEP